MKEGINPVDEKTTLHCICGNVIETRSTKKAIAVEICSSCHPYYTGKHKLIDTAGKIEKFRSRYSKTKGA